MLKPIAIAAAWFAAILPGPAFAEKAQAPNTSTGDPNERICENIVLTGSRLATKRFCGTRAEWAERRRADREALEGAQKNVCVLTHNGSSGRPAC
ncbi:MAG: hypothetical protein HOP96_12215 [Sphingomonas sp.]|nr:hypothetical protein [Sphingomonas sp.]